jgi:hypothetical protein
MTRCAIYIVKAARFVPVRSDCRRHDMTSQNDKKSSKTLPSPPAPAENDASQNTMPPERNGPKGPEPTRYGDWENGGRCTDF